MTRFDTVAYSVVEGRAEVMLNRPEVLNAYDSLMLDELTAALEMAIDDDSVYVIILSGNGRGFCSGVDLDRTTDHGDSKRQFRRHREAVDAVYRLLYRGSKPTIAAINGPAVGAGFGFAISCDIRIVSESAMLRDGHLNVGLFPSAPAGWRLPQLIGEGRAREILLTGRDIDPEEAFELGLASAVVEDDELMTAARTMANRLRDKPAVAMRRATVAINAYDSFEEYARRTVDYQWECRQNDEYEEAIKAFHSGREPEYERPY